MHYRAERKLLGNQLEQTLDGIALSYITGRDPDFGAQAFKLSL
jgi:hypothetical protein